MTDPAGRAHTWKDDFRISASILEIIVLLFMPGAESDCIFTA